MNAQPAQSPSWFIIDAPISTEAEDAFGHADVAANLRRMVSEASTDRRMIGLFGGFGVGKSTVIKLLARKLDGNSGDLRLVRMSAERHEPVGFHRAAVYAFAEALVEADEVTGAKAETLLLPLRVAQTSTISDITLSPLYRALEAAKSAFRLSWVKFIFLLAGAVALGLTASILVSLWVPDELWARFGAILTSGLASLGILAPILWLARGMWSAAGDVGQLTQAGKTAYRTARAEAADEQERTFAALAQEAKHRLVVAVDDIDRLSQDQILDALNAIRSFQLTCPAKSRPIFIVSLDETIVKRAISAGGLDGRLQIGNEQEFLNRLFTLRQEMPIHEKSDLRDYAAALLKDRSSGTYRVLGPLADDVVSVLVYEGVRDPRHVIRLLNAFIGNLRLATGREARQGARSLQSSLVTQSPQVLARITVIKSDFPAFFNAILTDARLLDVASRARNVDVTPDDRTTLSEAGFDVDEMANRPLFNYLSRTAGWVPPVPDIVPFLYLGQDRFSRNLGNGRASEIKNALSNNVPIDLLKVFNSASDAKATDSLIELIVDVLRELSGLEKLNGAEAILEVAGQKAELATQGIADIVASLLSEHPALAVDSDGCIALLSVSERGASANAIAQALLVEEEHAEYEKIWQNRALLEKHLGEAAVVSWAMEVIERLDDWADFEAWACLMLPDNLSHALLNRSLIFAGLGDHEPSDSALSALESLARSITSREALGDVAAAGELVSRAPNRSSAVLALTVVLASSLRDKDLALMCARVETGAEALDDGAIPDDRMVPLLVELIRRTAQEAPKFGNGTGEARVFSVTRALRTLASWVVDGPADSQDVLQSLAAVSEAGIPGHMEAAEAIVGDWREDPSGIGRGGMSNSEVVKELSGILRLLEPDAISTIGSGLQAALLDEMTRVIAIDVATSFLVQKEFTGWADEFVTELLAVATQVSSGTPSALDAIAAIVNGGQVSPEVQIDVAAKMEQLVRYPTSKSWVLDSVGSITWEAAALARAVELASPYFSSMEPAAFWSLFDQQSTSGEFDEVILSSAMDLSWSESGEFLENAMVRASVLCSYLPIRSSVEMALAADSNAAFVIVAERFHSVDEMVAVLWFACDARGVANTSRLALRLRDRDSDAYGDAVSSLLDETLDLNTAKSAAIWAYVTGPLPLEECRVLWARASEHLTGSVEEARLASNFLATVEHDSKMDDLVAVDISKVFQAWIATSPDAPTASLIARKIRNGPKSRAEALSSWKRPPRIADRRRAYDAAREALGS